MEKNVTVVDENGKEYEATYPKRAKGLVKNGRARFIGENKICLACPPQMKTEDKIMSENTKYQTAPENTKAQDKTESAGIAAEQQTSDQGNTRYSIDYCLEQIARIQEQTEYLNQVIAKLGEVTEGNVGDIAGQGKTQALGDVVKCRETTNQKLIAFYEKIYDDLKPDRMPQSTMKIKAMEMVSEIAKQSTFSDPEEGPAAISDILDTIRHIV